MEDYMFLEMSETPEVVRRLVEGHETLDRVVERVAAAKPKSFLFTGCGSSYYAGLTGTYASHQLVRIPGFPLSALDFLHYRSVGVGAGTILFALSQSGETAETVRAAQAAHRNGAQVVAVTNNADSALGKLAAGTIPLFAGEECGPGTKTVVAETLAIYMFFLKLAQRMGTILPVQAEEAWKELARAAEFAQRLQEEGRARQDLVRLLSGRQSIFVVGTGPYSALAFQAANVLKETTKLHTEGFEVAEFRHGPLEMVDERAAIISLGVPESPLHRDLLAVCSIGQKAGALWVGVTSGDDEATLSSCDVYHLVPKLSELLGSVLVLSVFQEWSYAMSRGRGFNPNIFRNINKTWREE
ncbi:MAG: SIS domain-containing protein [Betaproteobacteria bacterium]